MPVTAVSRWAQYDHWNSAVAEEFFGGRHGGRPVYLDLEDNVLSRVAQATGASGLEAGKTLVDAVGPTLAILERGSIFGAHRKRLAAWKIGGRVGPPPVVAVLALLSFVAEQMVGDAEFRSSNYYGRFLRTLGFSPEDRNLHQKVVRCFGAEAPVLWAALNDWLAEEPSTRGIATAFAFDYRVHVGVAMSQALVREADRAALVDLFLTFRLAPGQRLERADMARLLRGWLPSAPVSRSLRAFCANDEALQRVADIACIELASWDGGHATTSTGGSRPAGGRLALVATFRKKPRPRLSLGFAARVGQNDARLLEVVEGAQPGAQRALAQSGGLLELAPHDERGWADISNISDVALPIALGSVLTLSDGEVTVTRQPRRLIVLAWDEERRRFIETDRVRLGDQYLLLVADSLTDKLDAALNEAARPGWSKHQTGSVAGVPAGWSFYNRVEIVAITTAKHLDLAALIPVAWTQLSGTGGLSLPGRNQWLAKAPPQITASSLTGNPAVAILAAIDETSDDGPTERALEREEFNDDATFDSLSEDNQTLGSDEPEPWPAAGDVVLGDINPVGIFDLSSRNLVPGVYRVTLHRTESDRTALAALSVTLVGEPLPNARSGFSYPLPIVGAGLIGGSAGTDGIRGALIPATTDDREDAATLPPTDLTPWLADPSQEKAETQQELIVAADDLAECMRTEAHYFNLPPTANATWGTKEIHGVCHYCGLERSFPARPTPKATASSGRNARLTGAASVQSLPALPDSPEGCDYDLLLSALCASGQGSWRSLQRLVDQMDDQPWAARQAAQRLTALGHLDVAIDPRTLRATAWSISPPTLVAGPEHAFLAGWRSASLLNTFERLAEQLGLTVTKNVADAAPEAIRIHGAEDDDLWLLAAELSDVLGTEIRTAVGAYRQLTSQLPTLATVRNGLPLQAPPLDADLERFDTATGRWVEVRRPSEPGGYRSRDFPRLFWHSDGRDWRLAEAQIVKWLAADSLSPMIAYEPSTERLACHLGCQLPGMAERAAVLCSGTPPQLTANGHVVYEGIPPSIAAGLMRRLSPTPSVSTAHVL